MRMSPLGMRLQLAANDPDVSWHMLAENIPVWPDGPPMPNFAWDDAGSYAPSQGMGGLLDAICEREAKRGVRLSRQSLIITNGAFDGLGLVARHLAAKGLRRAVCGGPILLSVSDLFSAAGLQTVVQELGLLVNGQSWENLGLGKQDLVYINTPHNPTGACLDEHAMAGLYEAQTRLGFTLILDLVYDSFVHIPQTMTSPSAMITDWDNIYALNSFSKNYGAPGLRVGWVTAAPEAVEMLCTRLEWERIAVSSNAQLHAAHLCAIGNEELVCRVRAGRTIALEWSKELDAVASTSEGGTHLWIDLRVGDADAFADELMAEHRLIISTGANYCPRSSSYIRLPFGVEPELLQWSLQTIGDVVRRRRQP